VSIHRLIIEMLGRDRASGEMRKVRSEADTLAGSFTSLQGVLGAVAASGFVYMAKQAASAAWELGKVGALALRTEASFDDLAQRIGETGDSLRTALSDAAGDTMDNMTLMQTSAGLLASGIQTSTEDMVLAMEIARLKAQQFGLTTTEAYYRMLTGARKFSVEMLDEIGINLRAESVYKRKADALGVATDALTDAQKAESLWQAILDDGRNEIEQYGHAVDDYATDIERAEAAMDNAAVVAKEALAPAVASVARAIADTLPQLVTTVDQLGILAEAGIKWAEAALEGKDATAEFNAIVAEGIGAIGEASRIRLEAARATVSALEVEIAAEKEAMAQGDLMAASRLRILEASLKTAQAELDLAQQTDNAGRVAKETMPLWEQHAAGLLIAKDAAEQLALTEAELADIAWRASVAVRKGGADIYEYRRGLLVEQDQVDPLQQIIDLNEQIPSLMLDNERAVKSMGNTWKDTWDDVRSAIESALSPTTVTQADLEASEAGTYVEKWDEAARQLDAIAARGFAELEAHPDWAEALKIPPEILAGTEEQLKAWSDQTAIAVRELARPDLLNMDAAVEQVAQYFRDQAAKELSLDMITEAVLAKGVVTGEDAKAQVAQALGLEEPTVSLGLTIDEESMQDMSFQGQRAVEYIMQGYKGELDTAAPAAEFGRRFLDDIGTSKALLQMAGTEVWKPIWTAIKDAIYASPFVKEIASAVSPYVARELKEQGVFG
jgi:hypothetical protein